jgi:hypothetical protein
MLYGLIRPFHSKERNYKRLGVRGSNRLIPIASGIGHTAKSGKITIFTRKNCKKRWQGWLLDHFHCC